MAQTDTQAAPSGRESLLPARPGRTLAITAVALAASVGVTSLIGSNDSEPFTGYVRAHVVPITVPTQSRVVQITVEEGEWIEPGREIARVFDENLAAERRLHQSIVAGLEAELDQAQAKAAVELQWRTADVDAQILETRLKSAALVKDQFASQIEALAWRDFVEEFDTFKVTASRDQIVTLLTEKKLLDGEKRTRAMLLQASARNASEVYATQVKLCDDRLSQLKTLKRELPQNVERAAGVDEIQLRLAAARAELQNFEGRAEEISLRAPGYGTLGILRYKKGDLAQAGETLVELLDDDRRFVSVRVPSRALSDFALGGEVKLVFPENEPRTGIIKSISPQAILDDSGTGESLVELSIQPTGKLWPQELIVGTPVTVSAL